MCGEKITGGSTVTKKSFMSLSVPGNFVEFSTGSKHSKMFLALAME